ncbi:MAG: TorF family putative porin, partial [Burkholderiaceae bacterium]
MKFQKVVLASLLATTYVTSVQAADPAPAPESTLSFNLGVFSEYRYRGISQSAKKPALQGGFDYADK